MRKPSLIALSLSCALALCGCGESGNVRPVTACPKPATVSPELMKAPTYEQQTRQLLFVSPQMQMPKSVHSKP